MNNFLKSALFLAVSLSLSACSNNDEELSDDYDSDGVVNWLDVCPLDPNGSVDTDGDGICDGTDLYPNDPILSGDSDGDDVDNLFDAFPDNASESLDTDEDGIGNNADTDDDNDGVADTLDALPLDPYETKDSDGDGIGDNRDYHLNRGDYECFEMDTTEGIIQLALDAKLAPISTANFQSYVAQGFYDGLIFHRVIEDFMIQGGGFQPGMIKKETDSAIKLESSNGLMNFRGTIAMARTSQPDTATSQFFINTVDNHFLDKAEASDGYGYAVFGWVIGGLEVVDTVATVETTSLSSGYSDVPVEDIVITSMQPMVCPNE